MTGSELLGFKYRFEPGEGDRTLLLLHGTGADENALIPLGRTLDPEANLLSPRGKVLENGSARFFRRFAEGVLDVEDLMKRTHELVDFIEAAAEQHEFDSSQVIAAGFSNGANIGASMLLLHPRFLSAAILLRPMMPFEPEDEPDLSGTNVFIASGRTDPLIDPKDPERLAQLLESFGADVALVWRQGGHQLELGEAESARSWFERL
ncbi:MAG TPA: alpha/beta hydrolase [Actinomycetota bacterium]|nr:alpha/beta hydrolase [Actinomycetota bacterium]